MYVLGSATNILTVNQLSLKFTSLSWNFFMMLKMLWISETAYTWKLQYKWAPQQTRIGIAPHTVSLIYTHSLESGPSEGISMSIKMNEYLNMNIWVIVVFILPHDVNLWLHGVCYMQKFHLRHLFEFVQQSKSIMCYLRKYNEYLINNLLNCWVSLCVNRIS